MDFSHLNVTQQMAPLEFSYMEALPTQKDLKHTFELSSHFLA